MDRPDLKGRRYILDVHVKGKPLSKDVDLDLIARQTPGFVGADLENLVNEAAILAARRNRRAITMSEMQESIERIAMGGPERRSRLVTARERKVVAYHEAGHAVVAHLVKNADPLRKISIVPRGQAGGVTLTVPTEDRYLVPRSYFIDRIAVGLGGRVAEELIFGDISNGASGDIQQITHMARAMVTKYGMSEALGPLQIGRQEENVFLGREMSVRRDYSEEVAEQVDDEVRNIIGEAYKRVTWILTTYRTQLEAVAEALLERETLDSYEFEEIFEGRGDTEDFGGDLAPQPA
jgi:cell division protease FtsH